MWFLDRLDPGSLAYVIRGAVRLKGALDVGLLERCLGEVVGRHESLRTHFEEVEGEVYQRVSSAGALALRVEDLGGESGLEAWLSSGLEERFDLLTGPLFRASLGRVGADDHVLAVFMHHIVSDGWSIGLLIDEVSRLYSAYASGGVSPLSPLPVQYADYALWQRGRLTGGELERQLGYWRDRLAGCPEGLDLPTDRPRPSVQSYRGAEHDFALEGSLVASLRGVARDRDATLFMVLLAAFQLVLSRWSGQEDIVVGTPVAGRTRGETEGLIGFFVNTLALRTDLSGDPSFAELLARVRETSLGAYGHAELPFEKLVEDLRPVRDLSRQPIFQVMLNLLNVPLALGSVSELSVSPVRQPSGGSKFDLTLTLSEMRSGLECTLEYATDLFDGSTIARFSDHLVRVLEAVVADPSRRLSEISLMSAEDLEALLVSRNATEAAYPSDLCVPDLFGRVAASHPSSVALVFEGREVSYGDLDRRSNQLAHHLRSLGVGPDVVVGLQVPRSVEMVLGLLGILKSGGAYLPLDPDYPRERLDFMLRDSGASVLLTVGAVEALPGSEGLSVVLLDDDWSAISGCSAEAPDAVCGPENLAYVIYTSGSTGRPKGVMGSHGNAVKRIAAQGSMQALSASEVCCQKTSIGFVDSIYETLLPLCSGSRLVIAPAAVSEDASQLSSLVSCSGVTRLVLVPSLARALVEQPGFASSFSGLRVLSLSGEALDGALADRLRAALPSARLMNLYGSSEVSADTTWQFLEAGDAVGIGVPLANTQVYVLDGSLAPVPEGLVGELYVGGVGLARGYVGRPDLTAERFVPSPFGEGERLYRTGDLVRWGAEGRLLFEGRRDHQVKVRGFRIELGEIEAVLGEQPGVGRSVVVVQEREGGDRRLVVYVVAAGSEGLDVPGLRAALRLRLPEHMVPSHYHVLDALPLTPSGKLDRASLPLPRDETRGNGSEDAPRSPVEESLAKIWCEVLKIESVGIHDNFFDLGGHSLIAVRVVSRLRDTFGISLPLRHLFTWDISDLAAHIELAKSQEQKTDKITILKSARSEHLPLSFAQERLWFLDQVAGESVAYNLSWAIIFEESDDHRLLERALSKVVERHEVLRTRYYSVDGEPFQAVQTHDEVRLPVYDLRGQPEELQLEKARSLALFEAAKPFDLKTDMPLRGHIILVGPTTQALLLTVHHIAFDGWSIGLFVREFSEVYGRLLKGEKTDLPALPIQYADYTLWQRQYSQGERLDRQCDYWRKQLAGAPTLLDLRTDYPRSRVVTDKSESVNISLGRDLTAKIETLAKQQNCTPFMVLFAAFNVLLARYSGQDDIVIGSPIANRTSPQTEQLIGFFANVLLLRERITGDPRFLEFLDSVRRTTLEALEQQEVPFERLAGELRPTRDLSYSPWFQVMFAMQNFPTEALEILGRPVRAIHVPSGKAMFDLVMSLAIVRGELSGALTYKVELFREDTIRRMASNFETLLAGLVEAPDTPLSRLPLLGDEDIKKQLVDWNATQSAIEPTRCVHELIEEQVDRSPAATALSFDDRAMTYEELDRRSNQLAHRLRALGVGPDVVVTLVLDRSFEMFIALLGVLKAGGAYLPIEPTEPEDRAAAMIRETGSNVLVTHAGWEGRLPTLGLERIVLDSSGPEPSSYPDTRIAPSAQSANLAYIIYTSGSTGRPKGIAMHRQGMRNLITWRQASFRLSSDDAVLLKAPYSADFSVPELFWPLTAGARIVVAEPGRQNDPEYCDALINQQSVTVIDVVPSLLALLLESGQLKDGTSVKQILSGGEALTTDLARACQESCDAALHNLYGPTECCVDAVHGAVSRELLRAEVPIGRPIANTRAYVLDSAQSPVPVGVVGELYIGGMGLARGYVGRPDLTAESFVPDPFGQSERLYRTGDLARWSPEGVLEFLGRSDHQVKIRGYRVELGEIEAILSKCPEVSQAVATVREDVPGDQRLIAYAVPRGTAGIDEQTLRSALRQSLPDHMIPSMIVALDSLPLMANGKVDRKRLPEPDGRSANDGGFVAPRSPVESTLAEIWSDLLRVEPVGVQDNFFDLGGHSLLGMRAVSRIRKSFAVDLPLRALFEAATLAELAARVEVALREESESSLPAMTVQQRPEAIPLSFMQERLFFLNELGQVGSAYNISAGLQLRGKLNDIALEQSFAEVVRRHESLRTRFTVSDGRPVQAVMGASLFGLDRADLTKLPWSERNAEARRRAAAVTDRPFDLAVGPLLRALLVKLSEESHVLVVVVHHIAADGWSLEILIREVATLYGAYVEGRDAELQPVPLQYADFAIWHRQWILDSVLDEQLPHWTERLEGAPPVITLPTDLPRPEVPTHKGAHVPFELSQEHSDSLRRVGREQGVTLNMLLLAAFKVMLSRWCGQQDLVVGTPTAGRGRPEIEGLIGFFVNTLALRTDLSGDPTFLELLDRVKETSLDAYAHQDLPFELLVESLRPARDLGRQPIFQVMFVFDNTSYERESLPGLELKALVGHSSTARLDLTLYMFDGEQGIHGSFEYAADLFRRDTIERMSQHLQNLLSAVISNPASRLSDLPMLSDREEEQLVVAWNATRKDYERERCIHDLFAEQAESSPEGIALLFEDQKLTYRELDRRSSQLAAHLRALGIGPDKVVGLCLERSVDLVIGLLGILKAGGAYLPLDPSYPAKRLSSLMADAKPAALVTSTQLSIELDGSKVERVHLDSLTSTESDVSSPTSGAVAQNLAYVIYTSGSTGEPKGVAVTHQSVIAMITWARQCFTDSELGRVAATTSVSFDLSVFEILVPLCTGGGSPPRAERGRAGRSARRRIHGDQCGSLCSLPVLARGVSARQCSCRSDRGGDLDERHCRSGV